MEEGNDKSLSELNDRVMNRQERAITALEAVASHIPERSERPQILSALKEAAVQPATTVRPLMIFTAPEPARVIASVPDGPPMSLTWRRVTRRIVKAEGPERIAPEWWQMTSIERPRDYYAIEDDKGRRYWIFREGLYGEESGPPPKWFVHGLSA
jgi:protein ImuB